MKVRIHITAFFFCLALLGSGVAVVAGAQTVEQQQVMSVLTLNLARFTDWPEQSIAGDRKEMKLCVIGNNIVQESFEVVDNLLVNGRNLQVVSLSRLRNMDQCQILFVSDLERTRLMQLLLEMKNKPMLTVGETLDFVKAGGMVSFENIEGKIHLNINLNAVKQSGLVISSRILKLARIID